MSSLISVDLPAPDGPTRKTKSPSGMTRSTSRRATLPFGYCLVTSWRTRTGAFRARPGRGFARGPGCGWSAPRAVRVAMVTVGSAGETAAIGPPSGESGWTPSAGTAGGATSRLRLPLGPRRAANGPACPAVPATCRPPGAVRLRAGRARSAGSARSRRTGGPSRAGPGTARGGSRPRAARRARGRRAPPIQIAKAPRGTTAEVRWPRIGASSASSRTATGPSRPASPA